MSRLRHAVKMILLGIIAAGTSPLLVLVIAMMYAVCPAVRLRLHMVGPVRNFGWLCSFPDRIYRRIRANPDGAVHIFIMHSPANNALMKMWKRELFIVDCKAVYIYLNQYSRILRRIGFFQYDDKLDDYYTEYSPKPGRPVLSPSLRFTSDEERAGREWLEGVGIGTDDWFICFHNRDNAHRASIMHEARNCSLRSYLAAAEHIVAQGGFAVRVGADVEEAVPPGLSPRIVDYASRHRSEFLDVYLLAKNRFFLGNTSGVSLNAVIFNRPCAVANILSISDASLSSQDYWIPKNLWDAEEGRYLSFAERMALQQNPHCDFERLFRGGGSDGRFQFHENTADEILDLCLDMIDRVEGRPLSAEAQDLQARSKRIINRPEGYFDVGPRYLARWADVIFR